MSMNALGNESILRSAGSPKVVIILLIIAILLCVLFYFLPLISAGYLSPSSSNTSYPASEFTYSVPQKIIGSTAIGLFVLCAGLVISLSRQLKAALSAGDIAQAFKQEASIEIAGLAQQLKEQEQRFEDLESSMGERNFELQITLQELSEKNVELEKLSAIDPLTGLMNRRFFDKQIIAECRRSRRELTPLSIAMLDIDFFKKVNDEHGHLGGDHCLQAFARILKKSVKRPSDIICRYGGEEFVLILPNTDKEGLALILEKVRLNVQKEKIVFEGKSIPITVSIGGCSKIINEEDEKDTIIAKADKRLYHAKENGRNRVDVDFD